MHLADAFIQSNLHLHSSYSFYIFVYVYDRFECRLLFICKRCLITIITSYLSNVCSLSVFLILQWGKFVAVTQDSLISIFELNKE